VSTGLTFADAVEAVRAGGVFTTHTPVPAGIDRFERSVMERYFATFATQCGTTFETLMALGHRDDEPDETRFNMAVMACVWAVGRTASPKLHGAVSREMFGGLWPDIPVDEVPIGAITNWRHAHTWISEPMDACCADRRRCVGRADEAAWKGVEALPAAEIWSARRNGLRASAVGRVRPGRGLGDATARSRRADDRLRPALRTYKRATFCCRSPTGCASCCSAPTGRAVRLRPARRTPPTSRARR